MTLNSHQTSICTSFTNDQSQAVNLRGVCASINPRFEAGIPDFMNGIINFLIHFNVVNRKVDWRNPKMKSLNSMPESPCLIGVRIHQIHYQSFNTSL